MTLLGKQLCGSEPWTRKQRDAQEIETIKVRFLRLTLESRILERLRIYNIPIGMKIHKILDNLKSYKKDCLHKLKGMDTYN